MDHRESKTKQKPTKIAPLKYHTMVPYIQLAPVNFTEITKLTHAQHS